MWGCDKGLKEHKNVVLSQCTLNSTERWPSGLRYLLGKQAYEQSYRGFESPPFRRKKFPNLKELTKEKSLMLSFALIYNALIIRQSSRGTEYIRLFLMQGCENVIMEAIYNYPTGYHEPIGEIKNL